MGRASEAGYSLEPEPQNQNPRSEYGTPEDMRSPPYINTETQLQLHTLPTQSPTSAFRPPTHTNTSPSSSTSKPKPTWKRFAIPTATDSLSSGFPFHQHLYTLKITHDQWHLFTSDVVSAAKMTGMEDYLAWTTGITAGTLTSPFLLVLAPVVGYYSGKAVHKKTLVKTVKEKLGQEGGLRGVLRKWNDTVWVNMGFQAWLELPREKGELGGKVGGATTVEIEAATSAEGDGQTKVIDEKKRKKIEKKAARRFRIILVPIEDGDDMSSSGNNIPDYILGIGSDSESGSVSGMGVSERGMGVSERGMGGNKSAWVDPNDFQADDDVASPSSRHRETQPPAYWDANAVDGFNNIQTPQGQQQQGVVQGQGQNQQQQISSEADVVPRSQQDQSIQQPQPLQMNPLVAESPLASPHGPSQREAPLESEIRYTRSAGFTNV